MVLWAVFLLVPLILRSLSILLEISSLDIPVSYNVSMTSSFNLLKFSFSSLHYPVRTTQDLLECISNSSVFTVSCSWRTDVKWLADASPPSSAITRSSLLTIRANSLSIATCCCWIITSEAAWFLLSGASAAATSAFPVS